jgi:hypothetical protein
LILIDDTLEFQETKRPSKEMQVTIARQLGLEPTTVGNFFMNARRRSMDKWKDESDPKSLSGSIAMSPSQLDLDDDTDMDLDLGNENDLDLVDAAHQHHTNQQIHHHLQQHHVQQQAQQQAQQAQQQHHHQHHHHHNQDPDLDPDHDDML